VALRTRRRLDGLGQSREWLRVAGQWLADAVESADLERRQGGLGAALRQRGHHDHRHRPELHDLVEKLDAVHVRHLDVESDHIGVELLYRRPRFKRVGSLTYDLDSRIGAQDRPDQAPHRRRVINNEYTCFVLS
jgi:hypothetical protein